MALDGTTRETIGREIVRLQAEYYGRGPTRARTFATGDVVVVMLEETFTPAERTLISRGVHGYRRAGHRPHGPVLPERDRPR